MSKYYGNVVLASPSHVPPREYICVMETATQVWLIPVEGRIWSNSTKYVPITGDCAWNIIDAYHNLNTFREVVRKLRSFIAVDGAPNAHVETARANLDAASFTLSEMEKKQDHFLRFYSPNKGPIVNSHFFRPCPTNPCRTYLPSKVGKLLFVECGTLSGECICVEQSADFFYVVPTSNSTEGRSVMRLPIKDTTVVREYEDDSFVEEFADRLGEFSESYDDHLIEGYVGIIYEHGVYDSARTTARSLTRMIADKESRKRRFISEFQSAILRNWAQSYAVGRSAIPFVQVSAPRDACPTLPGDPWA